MKTALIDGDILAYQAAASAENISYLINNTVSVKYKKDVEQFARDYNLVYENLLVEKKTNPLSNQVIVDELGDRIRHIVEGAECDDFILYISGETSFRKGVYEAYKANRAGIQKPSKLDFVRDTLVGEYRAIKVDGIEADDALGIHHCSKPGSTVICTIDKDLLMIPGKHYKWSQEGVFDVYPHEAGYNFFIQLLTGDTSDNVCGIRGVGKRTAERMLEGVETAYDCMRVVERQYAKQFSKILLRELDEVIDLNATLLWIKRHTNSEWREVLDSF